MSKRFTIKEQDRNRILKLYGLSEQTQPQQAPQQGQPQQNPQAGTSQETQTNVVGNNLVTTQSDKMTIDLKGTWPAGKYLVDSMTNSRETYNNINELLKYALKRNVKKFTINIDVGESQVTNIDRESCSDQDVKADQKSCEVPPGVLSNWRGKTLQKWIMQYPLYIELTRNRGFKIDFKVNAVVGKTPYVKRKNNPKDSKYQKDIFLRITADLSAQTSCLLNGTITVYVATNEHTCDAALFNFYINDVNLGIVNLNNSYYDIFSKDMDKEIVDYFDLHAPMINAKYGKNYTGQTLRDAINNLKSSYNLDKGNNRIATERSRGGARSCSFVLTKDILSRIAPKGTDKLVFAMETLIKPGSDFHVFDHSIDSSPGRPGTLKGPHLDTPNIDIKLGEKSVWRGKIAKAVGGNDKLTTGKTTILTTDLCGVPIGLKQEVVAKK